MKAKYLNMFFAGKKGDKSGDFYDTMKLLVSSIGGERALARKSPICAGRYNSTKANDVSSTMLVLNRSLLITIVFYAGSEAAVQHF